MNRGAAPLLLALLLPAGCGGEPAGEAADMSDKQVAGELAQMRIDPGLWQIGTDLIEVEAPGLPREIRNRMIGPRSRLKHCITPEQAARPDANFLAGRANSECRYRDFRVEEGRLSGTMSCPEAEARMEGVYRSDRYATRLTMESPMPDGNKMIIELRSAGQRVGPCEGEEE